MTNLHLPPQGTVALLVATVLLTLLANKMGAKLLELFARPFLWLWEAFYKRIAPHNPLSLSLRSYKKHLKNSDFLSLLENPVGPALRVPLDQSFAPLRLTSGENQPYIELFTYVAETRRFIVLGGPGTGKTTLMKSLLMSILNGTSHEKINGLIPVFVALRRLCSSQQSVDGAIIAAFGEHHFPGAERFVRSALEQGRMVIVLDGLDEVGSSREFAIDQIQKFCRWENKDQRNHLIVTCRENSYLREDLRDDIPSVVRVEPFAPHHMRCFLIGWPAHKGKVAMNLFGPIQHDRQIREICCNPLLLTILTGLYYETEDTKGKDFELPPSRNEFYKRAIKELLENRAARRAIKQTYGASDKQEILQRVALERLEAARPDEDPEEFTRDAICRRAEEFWGKKLEPEALSDLLKELIEINGIIKPASEQSYTCSHRTIQEYLAAREAQRSLEVNEVIGRFGEKTYLREVIFFYCGRIDNVPQITTVISHFAARHEWQVAGRCLLNATQLPNNPLSLRDAADGLFQRLKENSPSDPALEILSSLAQRRGREFEPFVERLNDSINLLTDKNAGSAVSGLASALAANPEMAMQVMPNLLVHESAGLRKLAISLLRDIGTDEALDQLVQHLGQASEEDKTEVARVISSLIKTRRADMKQRAMLLEERKDPTIWPLEAYFPGSLAIPVAEALATAPETENRAISSAARVAGMRHNATVSREDAKFVRQWRRTRLYAKIFEAKRKCAGRTALVADALGLLAVLLIVAVLITSSRGYLVIAQAYPPRIKLAKHLDAVNSLSDAAKRLVSEAEGKYPASAHGLARVWPWNWDVHPIVPGPSKKPLDLVTEIQFLRDPYSISWGSIHPEELPAAVGRDTIDNFELAASKLRSQSVPVSGRLYLLFGLGPRGFSHFAMAVFFVVALLNFRYLRKRVLLRSADVDLKETAFINLYRRPIIMGMLDFMPFYVLSMSVIVLGIGGPLAAGAIWLGAVGIVGVFLFFAALRSNWPTNPAFESSKDVLIADRS